MQPADPSWDIILNYFPDLTDRQKDLFERLYPLYADWNSKINMISRKDTHFFYECHVLHSLAIAKLLPLEDGTMVLDVGTGGGFPGIPLAICHCEINRGLMKPKALIRCSGHSATNLPSPRKANIAQLKIS